MLKARRQSSPASKERLSRAPWRRMMFIHQQLRNSSGPNCTTLARALEVNRKTVTRDIEFMRDELGLPIEYDASLHHYFYSGFVDSLPMVNITEGELVSMFVAEKAVLQYKGTPFEAPLRSAFDKIVSQLPAKVSVALANGHSVVSFQAHGPAVQELELFDKVTLATQRGFEIEFDYRKLAGSRHESRILQPYHVACINGQWYVIGQDLDRKARRTFALPRISNLRVTNRAFSRPSDFTLEQHLGNAFGIFAGEGDHRVRIRLHGWAARIVTERFWHPTQTITEVDPETVEIEMRVSGFEELERWILGWGSCAEVLAPAELRQRIAEAGKRISKNNKSKA